MTTFLATAGADFFSGGAGDEISYANAPALYDANGFRIHQIIDYPGHLGGSTGWAVGDTVTGAIDHFRLSNYGDLFVSQTSSTMEIWVVGGAGNDTFFAGDGISHFDGGGTENSVLDPLGNQISYAYTGAVILSLDSSIANGGAAYGDTWTNVQSLEGSSYDDILYSVDDGQNHLLVGDPSEGYAGSTGNDILVGAITATHGAGADTFIPEGGADTVVFGARTNWLDYENATAGLTVDLLNPSVNTGDAAGDVYLFANGSHSSSAWQTLTSAHTSVVINFTGSDFGDTLSGTDGDNHILGDPLPGLANYSSSGNDIVHGRGGNDLIEGIGGADALYGDAGNDILVGGLGADALWGGTGADAFRYTTLQDSTAAGYDIIQDFESGTDHLDISGISSITSVSLVSSGGGTFLFSNAVGGEYLEIGSTAPIQASDLVVGAGVTSVYMVGDAGFNVLIGGGLDDTIQGGGGGDWLAGGGGADRFVFTATSDSAVAAPDSIFDFQTGVDKIDLTALHIGAANVNWLSSGGSTYVFIDTNLDATNDMLVQLNGTTSLSSGDFLY